MGTFLKVVAMIFIILAIVGSVFSAITSFGGIINTISYHPFINSYKDIFQVSFIVVSVFAYFFIIVFGVSFFVLGSIYNHKLQLLERFKFNEVTKKY